LEILIWLQVLWQLMCGIDKDRIMKKLTYYLSAIALLLFTNCKKDNTNSNGLPAVTQEGKNTLGFLLNGQTWIPQGNNGTGNLDLYYDATFQGGVFNLSAYRNISTTNGSRQSLVIYGDSIQVAQRIILPNKNKFGLTFWDEANHCTYDTFDSTTQILSGFFDLKKLDKVSRIFSGEFEIKFKKTGCDEVQVTQGRFDMKF
jgi:hypothetical protein